MKKLAVLVATIGIFAGCAQNDDADMGATGTTDTGTGSAATSESGNGMLDSGVDAGGSAIGTEDTSTIETRDNSGVDLGTSTTDQGNLGGVQNDQNIDTNNVSQPGQGRVGGQDQVEQPNP